MSIVSPSIIIVPCANLVQLNKRSVGGFIVFLHGDKNSFLNKILKSGNLLLNLHCRIFWILALIVLAMSCLLIFFTITEI